MIRVQRQEMRTLREDALTQRGRLTYADVTRTTQVKRTDTTLLVGNELLRDVHADKTNDGNLIKIRRLSGASFDEIGAMIDDAATEDHLKQIIILAGTHEMTEDVPTEKIQVDFKALLRKAQAVTSEITVISVLPVNKGNGVYLNDQLKSTCDEMDVKFVDNDTNFTFRNGTVDFTTLDRDGIHLSQSGTGRLMTNLSLPKPQRQNTHDRPTREAVQATRGASTTSDWTVVGRRSVPHPLGQCRKCGETNHVTATCRHTQKVVCRKCGKSGHKDKHHSRD